MPLSNRGCVGSRVELEDNRILAPVALVIRLQLRTQAARFDPDNGIDARIVGAFAIEDFDADEILLQHVAFTLDGAFHGEAQESPHAFGACE